MKIIINKHNGYTLAGLLALGTALNLFMQTAASRMNLASALRWTLEHGWLFWIGSFVMFFLLLAAASAIRNVYFGSLLMTAVILLVGTANYKKLTTTGEPLFPWDLMLVKNAASMSEFTEGMITPAAVAITIAVLAVLGWLIFRKLPKVRIHWAVRLVYVLVSVAAVAGFVNLFSGGHDKLFKRIEYVNYFWNPKYNYAANGFLFAFAADLKMNLMEEPDGYGEKAIREIAEKYRALPDKSAPAVMNGREPNIVFVMDEAFFDVTRLPTLSFSEDPLAFLHSLRTKTPAGWLLSPEFAGNTANVEFEALTGMSMYFLKAGTIPFQQSIAKHESMPSVASMLRDDGYDTVALHPFDKTFYNRNHVYPILGFNRFIGAKDMTNPERMTPEGYITDESTFKEAIRQLKQADKPTFLHIVTMQNHYPFIKGRNGPNTVKVTGLDGKLKEEMETYTQSTKLTDKALAYLTDAVKEVERPTIIVVWGDHLPALSGAIYKQTGWDTDQLRKHETPLTVISNVDIGQEPLGTLSPAFIGPRVFEMTGRNLPPFYRLLQQVKQEVPGLGRTVRVGADGKVIAKLTAEQEELLNDYRLVEYDMLLGKRYARKLMFGAE